MIHPADKKRDITLAFGKTGMGKTLWTQAYVRTLSRVIILDPMGEYRDAVYYDDTDKLIDHVARYKAFRVSTGDVELFPWLCKVASAAGDCTLVLEEAQRIMPPTVELPAPFQDIVYRGRHNRVSLVIVSQRPTTVHIAARSQWTRLITFCQTEHADAKWIQSVSGSDIDPVGLPRLVYFDVTPGGWERKVIAIPGRYKTMEKRADLPDSRKEEGQ